MNKDSQTLRVFAHREDPAVAFCARNHRCLELVVSGDLSLHGRNYLMPNGVIVFCQFSNIILVFSSLRNNFIHNCRESIRNMLTACADDGLITVGNYRYCCNKSASKDKLRSCYLAISLEFYRLQT
jgi:hypothetical protein